MESFKGTSWSSLLSTVENWYLDGKEVKVKFVENSKVSNDDEVHLDSTRSHLVLLYLFQTCCPSCHDYATKLNEIVGQYKDVPEFQCFGIQTSFEMHQVNTTENACMFQKVHKLNFLIGHDGLLDLVPLVSQLLEKAEKENNTEQIKVFKNFDTSNSKSSLFCLTSASGSPWVIIIKTDGDKINDILYSNYPSDDIPNIIKLNI